MVMACLVSRSGVVCEFECKSSLFKVLKGLAEYTNLSLGDLLVRYYNRQTLASDRARQTFVLPDRLLNKGNGKSFQS